MTRPGRAPQRGEQGFTLVELLVVMIVLGLLAAVAIPMYLKAQRSAYETSAKADIKTLAREIGTQFVDDQSDLDLTSANGIWELRRGGVLVADGELSKHNELSARSRIEAGGSYCLSVRNTKVGARFWLADDSGLRQGDCPP